MRILRQDGAEPGAILRHLWQAGLIALAASALVFLLARTTPFQDFDRWMYDFTVISAGLDKPDQRIVFVDFDDETFNRIKQFPIPRSVVANAVTAIAADKPRVIGMDILLSEPRNAEDDKAMQDALTKAGNVIVASQYSGGDIPTEMPLPVFCQPEDARMASGFCKEDAPGAMGYGAINLPVDSDGFIRRALLAAGDPPVKDFPVMMAQQYTGQGIKPLDHKRFSFLGRTLWYSDPELKEILIGSWGREPATMVPVWKLLAGQVPAGTFTDKMVVMGQSNDASKDRFYTPLFRNSLPDGSRPEMPGTQVLAATIKTLLDGTVVRPSPPLIEQIDVFAICWMCSFLILELRTKIGMTIALVWVLFVPFLLSLGLYIHARFWLPFLGQEVGLVLAIPITLFVQFIAERVLAREARSQRMQLMTLFSSYVDPAVAGTIWDRRDEVSLNGEERIATVMFTDIRSFTALSAGKPPAEVLTWLNQYMTAMDGVIRLHGGFLNKFIGDGLMIIFGLPLSHGPKHDASRGLHAAIAMLKRVEELNVENAPFPERPQLRIGVGIHTGPLMAGSIGSANRQEYSVIGETVNLASRLESLNKPMKTEILMSKATYDLLEDDFTGFEALGAAKVAGFEEPIEVYTIRDTA